MKHGDKYIVASFSGAGLLLVAAVTGFVLSLGHMGRTPVSMGVHQYLVEWCQAGQNLNILSQREAHAAGLLALALVILSGSKAAKRVSKTSCNSAFKTIGKISTLMLGAFCVSSAIWWWYQPLSKTAWAALSFAIVCFSLIRLNALKNIARLPFWWAAILAIAILSEAPGLIVPYDSSWMPANTFVEFQQGYSVVASQCDRIAMGHHIFSMVKPNYGVLLQVLSAVFEKYSGIFTLGQTIQIIRWLQALTLLIGLFVYLWYARMRAFPAFLAFLLILPWLHTNQISLLFPNLSPWRSFSFPLSAIALICCIHVPERNRYACLGLVAGICLTLNLETGIAVFVGLLSYTFYSKHEAGKLLTKEFASRALQLIAGTAAYLLVFYILTSVLLGYSPDLHAYANHLQTLSYMTKTGYSGGFRLIYAPLPIFIFCHYAYILIRSSFSTRPLTERECFRAYIAATALVWSAYYFNRPQTWYLQPQYFFFGILLIDIVRLACSKAWKSHTFENRAIAIMILVSIISPHIVQAFENAWPDYHRMLRQFKRGSPAEPEARLISGIYISKKTADELMRKTRALLDEHKRGKLLYLTGNTVLVPKITKLYLKTDFDDPFMELTYTTDTDRFVKRVKDSAVTSILIDADDSYLAGDRFRLVCWKNLEMRLQPEFQFAQEKDGWRILLRTGAIPKEPNDIGLDEAKK